MSHSYHQGPEDAVLYDGCHECDDRAANPLDGLLWLDETSLMALRQRVLDNEYGMGTGSNRYRSDNEARLGKALYRLLVLMERHPGLAR